MTLARNSIEGKAEAYLQRIDPLLAEAERERKACAERIKELRGDIKDIIEEAKGQGVHPKALRALLRHRDLSRKQRDLAHKLNLDEAAAFANLVEALGDLGQAAKDRHEREAAA